MQLIDGKILSAKVRGELKTEVSFYKAKFGRVPGIAVILVGGDSASSVYVNSKEKAASEVGFYSVVDKVSAETTTEQLLALVNRYNSDENIHGILVQLPLPNKADEMQILRTIKPEKDVDGFHPVNVGLLTIGEDCLVSCTPQGVMTMLKEYNIDVSGKNAVVIGRSNIVGKPMGSLLLKANATVTTCHSKTRDIADVCKRADILVAAIGKANFVTADFVKEGAVVIDVGMNRNAEGRLCGDVDFAEVSKKASFITPVPGGVGPMTIATLMQNTMKAFKLSLGISA